MHNGSLLRGAEATGFGVGAHELKTHPGAPRPLSLRATPPGRGFLGTVLQKQTSYFFTNLSHTLAAPATSMAALPSSMC